MIENELGNAVIAVTIIAVISCFPLLLSMVCMAVTIVKGRRNG